MIEMEKIRELLEELRKGPIKSPESKKRGILDIEYDELIKEAFGIKNFGERIRYEELKEFSDLIEERIQEVREEERAKKEVEEKEKSRKVFHGFS